MTNPNGITYDGEWVNGHMNGTGNLKFADGSSYCGQFQNGFIHGKGKFTNFNQGSGNFESPQEGYFSMGKFIGGQM